MVPFLLSTSILKSLVAKFSVSDILNPCRLAAASLFLLFSTKYLPTGPPTKLPATNPNVAAANVIVVAFANPACSRTGAKAADVPCPPVIGMEPVAIPINGSTPISLAIMAPKPFCNNTNTDDTIRNVITLTPPFLRSFILAVNPIPE
ncbi:hypothetical protein SDC9_90690 [bioreactor metagenome]|uniref:Uncharacterized protein n=1 Tax=bioreactor metagenome TaxID=1076179 RepID=A0A644ZT27_9ZZZZ